MPIYLGRIFLEQYLSQQVEFLQLNLLTVPSHIEILELSDCPLICISKLLLQKSLPEDEFGNADDEFHAFQKEHSGYNQNLITKYQLEDPKPIYNHVNIIAIDSDSDLGIFSSNGSSILDEETLNIVDSIVNGSICPNILDTEISDLLFEDLEEDEVLQENSPDLPSCLLKYLKPVRIKDPFSKLTSNDPSKSPSSYHADDTPSDENVTFPSIIRFKETEKDDKLLVDEVLVDDTDIEVCILLPEIGGLAIEELPELPKDIHCDTNKPTNETYDLNEVEPKTKTATTPLKFANQVPNEDEELKIDTPMSSVVSCFYNFNELPYFPESFESMQDDEKPLCLLSPNIQQQIMKRLETEEKSYGDTLLMLLPDPKEILILEPIKPVLLPPLPKLGSRFDKPVETHLEWDPMYKSKDVIVRCKKLLMLSKLEKRQDSLNNPFKDYFKPFENEFDEIEQVIEDWKLNVRKTVHLRHITSISTTKMNSSSNLQARPQTAKVGEQKISAKLQFKSTSEKIAAVLKNTPIIKAKSKVLSGLNSTFQSPLDTFLMLRKGQFCSTPKTVSSNKLQNKMDDHNIEQKSILPKKIGTGSRVTTVSAMKVRPFMVNSVSTTGVNPDHYEDQSYKEMGKLLMKSSALSKPLPRKCDLILSDHFLSILAWLSKDSFPLVEFLKESKCIHQNAALLTMDPDRARFLCKEDGKMRETGKRDNKDVTCALICLHALTQTVDLITHCSITTACGVLKSINKKFSEILRNCLEPIQKKLLNFHRQNEAKMIFHCKFVRIKELLLEWLESEKTSKIIILFGRYFDQLAPVLQSYLSLDRSLQIKLYPNSDVEETEYMNTFINSNIILAKESENLHSCPWKFFNYVIQYEFLKESCWHEMAFKCNQDLTSFTMLDVIVSCDAHEDEGSTVQLGISPAKLQSTVICSPVITANKELLLAVENTNNIQLLPKEFNSLRSRGFYCQQPDVLVDLNTGIVVLLGDEVDIDECLERVYPMKMKCSFSHVVFAMFDLNNKEWCCLVEQVTTALTVCNTKRSMIKIWYGSSAGEVAGIIRRIVDTCSGWNDESIWKFNEWTDETLSLKENFLLGYPFINLICAQIMLQQRNASLGDSLRMSLHQLKALYSNVPVDVLTKFYNANQQNIFNEITDPSYDAVNVGSANNGIVQQNTREILSNQQQTIQNNGTSSLSLEERNQMHRYQSDSTERPNQGYFQQTLENNGNSSLVDILDEDNNNNEHLNYFQRFESFQNLNLTNTNRMEDQHSQHQFQHHQLQPSAQDVCHQTGSYKRNQLHYRQSESMGRPDQGYLQNTNCNENSEFNNTHQNFQRGMETSRPSRSLSNVDSHGEQEEIDFMVNNNVKGFANANIQPCPDSRSLRVQPHSLPFWQDNKENIPRQIVKGIPSRRSRDTNYGSQRFQIVPDNQQGMYGMKFEDEDATLSKRRKLGFEKVPGSTNGQTRLTFK